MALTSVFPTQGLQNFIDETLNQLTAINGTPGAGQFRSSITNRAPITDIGQNLKCLFGVERIPTQQIYPLQTEFGSSGEAVFGVLNDDRGLIRFVGQWVSGVDVAGQAVTTGTSGNDYAEITFYGTGLNVLTGGMNITRDMRVTVDGGSESATIFPASSSGVLHGRNYSPNQILNVASGLALGFHTVKIRSASVSAGAYVYGFEILNESSTIKTNPGSAFVNGRRQYLASQDSQAYNSGFTNSYGVAGTKGGHVLVYLDADGTVKKDIQYVDTSQLNYPNADHSNEEVARVYNWREFGAGRSDDFSQSMSNSANNRAFTLDDGTTTLVGSSIGQADSTADTLSLTTNGGFLTITFVGTGLDIIQKDNVSGGSDSYNFQIDGGSTVSMASVGNTSARQVKICSGLPYGTHSVKFNRVTAGTFSVGFKNFIVYQPKKPSLPAGAVELADYNVMANYVANTNAAAGSQFSLSQGVICKSNTRELNFTGSPVLNTEFGNTGIQMGWIATSGTATTIQYTFFGTGFEFDARNDGSAATWIVNIDGANYTGAATAVGSGTSWTAGTSTFTPGGSGGTTVSDASKLIVNGLALGLHTVKFTSGGTNAVRFRQLNIITPVHSHKPNLYSNIENTLPVGSCAISDNRKNSAIKFNGNGTKAVSSAQGKQSSVSTTSTSYVPVPDMSMVINSTGGRYAIAYSITAYPTASGNEVDVIMYVDGVAVGVEKVYNAPTSGGYQSTLADIIILPLAPGAHKIDLMWLMSGGGGGTINSPGNRRSMVAWEI